MDKRNIYLKIVLGSMLLGGCSSQDSMLAPEDDDNNIIHVGGVTPCDIVSSGVATRSVMDDEKLDWLRKGLGQGLDITYKKDTETNKAILKLTEGQYTMTDVDTEKPAKWLGNGAHIFQGVYVPENLQKTGSHGYDDLSRYTAIPPSHKINATLEQIKIPLQHRLARVVAYVLIENTLGPDVWLMGYDETDEEKNKNVEGTMLRFCNVWTLDCVSEGKPKWKKERKVVPHYLGKMDNVRVYEDSEGKLIFPTDKTAWDKAQANNYSYTDYAHVPYYDIIVRPTYTEDATNSQVMYDEDQQKLVKNNQIDFELTLSNGLEYEKYFEFDLNANAETEVYLRVTPERIDYSSAGSRQWKHADYHDDHYGLNHEGFDLSQVGSSWQRAYTFTNNALKGDNVADGTQYNDTQYITDATQFITLLQTATTDKSCDGKYFILEDNITIDVSNFGDGFVFTGHLDGLDHEITLTDSNKIGRDTLFPNIGTGAEVLNVKYNSNKNEN